MTDTRHQFERSDQPGASRTVNILGVPLSFGQSMAGVDMGPSAMRAAGLAQRIAKLGYEVNDVGDIRIERSRTNLREGEKLKHITEVHAACSQLAAQVEQIVEAGEFPITIGGDHSIAIGSLSGVAKAYRERKETLGLVYFDAHADMNTPMTTPSGNIHGMPLAVLLGHGAPELVNLGGFETKFNPTWVAHVGARDIDPAEREMVRGSGLRCFTMREIDERG